MTSSTFQGIEKIRMSHLSLIKQTGQVCWQTIDQATTKTPLEDLHYKNTKKRLHYLVLPRAVPAFPSKISSIKELSSFSRRRVSNQ